MISLSTLVNRQCIDTLVSYPWNKCVNVLEQLFQGKKEPCDSKFLYKT